MFPVPIAEMNVDEFFRCDERIHKSDPGERPNPVQKTDLSLKGLIERALWNDEVLRAIEYYEVDVHVRNQVVHLSGHIANMASRKRIENAIRSVPGLRDVRNHLILDDKIIQDVSRSLGALEHTYGCKFFTGASHGVVSLAGIVSDENVRSLAEKCAAGNPNVRAVVNHLRIAGAARETLDQQPVLQPTIGETIYFRDGVFGTVKQVVIDPNNRRVIAMTLWGQFTDQRHKPQPLNGETRSPERLVVIGMGTVRHLTSTSGFLNIHSDERESYSEFDAAFFFTPSADWTPPYPYCPRDVLFLTKHLPAENQISKPLPRQALTSMPDEELLWEQLLANESLGG